jgi:hypothetical protein
MPYKRNRYGVTQIKPGVIDNLSINWDFDYNENKRLRFPVFLFTPWMKDTKTHYHIRLNRTQARKLRDWLNDYLADV